MICHQCGGSYKKKHKSLEISDKFIGPFKTTKAVDYEKCNKCGDILYPLSSLKQIEEDRNQALDHKLQSMPICAFISATEAALILEISRQALHKHRRIRRGFIYQTKFGDKTVYLKDSVRLFKKTGDGRFPLWEIKTNITFKYNSTEKTKMLPLYMKTDDSSKKYNYITQIGSTAGRS